mmetsp:Transcript_10154/g.11622  ORF Transcript_10154/g.11622 Transcript_10154/m.11622 type:complete len:285 (+) Transcript_10154:61-915(+)
MFLLHTIRTRKARQVCIRIAAFTSTYSAIWSTSRGFGECQLFALGFDSLENSSKSKSLLSSPFTTPNTLRINNIHTEDESSALNDLWSSSIEGMYIPYHDGILYMAPVQAGRTDIKTSSSVWPKPFQNGRSVFSLTGHNPMGKDQSKALNNDANNKLHNRIQTHLFRDKEVDGGEDIIKPNSFWRSFGFNVKERWREDGFTVSYDSQYADEGRELILQLAREFQQAAIYEYGMKEHNDFGENQRDILWRKVVWCDSNKLSGNEEQFEMETVVPPESEFSVAKVS